MNPKIKYLILMVSIMIFSMMTFAPVVVAQTEITVCSQEELTATFEIVRSVMDSFPDIYNLEIDGGTKDDLVISFGQRSVDYWGTTFPTIPTCVEAQLLAYKVGFFIDHSLIIVSLVNVALNAGDRRMIDTVDSLNYHLTVQFEMIQKEQEEILEIIGVEPISQENIETPSPETTSDANENTGAFIPQAGAWVGEGMWGFANLTVAFTITDDGKMIDVVVTVTNDTFGIDCYGDIGEVPIGSDGSVVITLATNEEEGKASELTGIFVSETSASGSASEILVCGDTVMEWMDAPFDGEYGYWEASPQD
jgi:hypothetical protein